MQLTSNYGLKKPEGTDIVNIDDLNANADIIDTQLKSLSTNKVDKVTGKQLSTNDYTTAEKNKVEGIALLQQQVMQHVDKSASAAHGAVRKEYTLFGGTLTNGSAILEIPSGFTSLNDFNEIIIVGTMARNNSGTWRHFTEIMKPISAINQQSFSVAHEMIFTTTETNKYWLRCVIDKSTKQLSVTYNRSKTGNAVGVDGTENAIGGVIGVKYN